MGRSRKVAHPNDLMDEVFDEDGYRIFDFPPYSMEFSDYMDKHSLAIDRKCGRIMGIHKKSTYTFDETEEILERAMEIMKKGWGYDVQ